PRISDPDDRSWTLSPLGRSGLLVAGGSCRRGDVIAVHLLDHVDADLLGARFLTLTEPRAISEPFDIHLLDHADHATVALGLALRQLPEMRDLGSREQRRRRVGARSHARTAADTGRGIHCMVGARLADQNVVAVRRAAGVHAHVTTALDDAIESAAIHDQILDDRERTRPPRLDHDLVTILERTHVQLTRGSRFLRTMRDAVDHHAARSADPFPAIVIERDGSLARDDQFLVHDVQHLQERHVGRNVARLVRLDPARVLCRWLAPDVKLEVHYL